MARAKKKPQPFDVNVFLSKANGGRTITSYRKNKKIFSQGDRADAVFYIQEGKVKVFVVSEGGKEAVVALHGKGDFFGEGCLVGQPLRLWSFTSIRVDGFQPPYCLLSSERPQTSVVSTAMFPCVARE